MSVVALLTGRKRNIGGIILDAVITESESNTVQVTSSPIENGSQINDHVIDTPTLYRMEGIVSDTESGGVDADTDASSLAKNFVDNAISSAAGNTFNPISGGNKRSQEAYRKLLDLLNKKDRFDVVTGLRAIKNVVLTRLEPVKDKSTANALYFRAEMEQIIIVNTEDVSTDINNLRNGETREQASPTVNKGRVSAPNVSTDNLSEQQRKEIKATT